MKNEQVKLLLYLLDEAFGSWDVKEMREKQSLLANLRSIGEKEWLWVPPQGKRTICEIVQHVGACKYMYDNHAFGEGKLFWADKLVNPWPNTTPEIEEVVKWLQEGQRRLRNHISELNDSELLEERKTNWGEMKETRWIIKVMLEHDLYHAGEINHIRSLFSQDDRWAYEKKNVV